MFFLVIALKDITKVVLKAKTGTEAVTACRNNPDIDLILMDIKMPQMDGYEATRQIRQFNKNVIIIAQTAFGLTGDREKAIKAGCNDYLPKPLSKKELMDIVGYYFNE
jgi:CheY-like chemotaxis protein